MNRTLAVLAVVVLAVLAGCGGLAGGGAGTPTGAGPDGTAGPSSPTAAEGTLEVHFINVGQSVSTLLVSPGGETMLVDSGDFTDDGEYVLGYLQRHGVDRLDALVVSHNDADHIGGNAAIIDYYETEAGGIGAVYDPGIAASTRTYEAYLDAVETHGVTLYETREGDSIPFAGADVRVLGPPDPYLANQERNENSVVLQVTHGRARFLLTGDAEDDQERYLVEEYGAGLRATVLKVGHHGSETSTGAALLDAVDPGAVVISSAYDSRYGHPHEAVLDRLAARAIPAYWTGTHGNVVLVSDGERVAVRTQRAAPTDARALRDADPVEPGTTDPVELRATIPADGGQATTVTPDGGSTPEPDGRLVVAAIHADARGDDREALNDEYVTFANAGESPLDLGGWTVVDAAGRTYTVPEGVTLDPGASVTLHTGSGTDTATDLYWGSATPVWNNDGDTIVVTNADGDRVLREVYP